MTDLRYVQLTGRLIGMCEDLTENPMLPATVQWHHRRLAAIRRVIRQDHWTTEQMDAALTEAREEPEPIASRGVITERTTVGRLS